MAYNCNCLLIFVWLFIVKLINIFYYCGKKEKYCIWNCNVKSMNQGKLEVVKQEMVRVNTGILGISSVQLLSHIRLFETPWTSAHQASMSNQLPELVQTHVHRVGDAIQPSCPPLFPSPPALNLSQHQDLFQWIRSSHQVAKVLELQFQNHSFQWIFRTDFL